MPTNPPADPSDALDDEVRPEYNFDYATARPNRFAKQRLAERTITLDPDVARVFTSDEAVNTVLRALITTLPLRATEHAA